MYTIIESNPNQTKVRFSHIPSALYKPLFEMFCSHLQNTETITGSGEVKRLRAFFAIYSILGLRCFREKPSFYIAHPECRYPLREAWPGMLTWLQIIGETDLRDMNMTGGVCIPLMLRDAFNAISIDMSFDILLDNDKVTALVTRLWLREDWDESKGELAHVSSSFWRYSRIRFAGRGSKVMMRTVETEGYRPTEALVLVFSRLRRALSLNLEAVAEELQVIVHLCHSSPKFVSSFMQVRGVAEIIRTLKKLETLPKAVVKRTPSLFSRSSVVIQCFEIFAYVIQTVKNPQQVINGSLKKSFFQALIRSDPQKDTNPYTLHRDTSQSGPIYFFVSLYGPFLSFSSVIACASKALMGLLEPSINAFSRLEEGMIKELWFNFFIHITELTILRTLINRRAKMFRCNNVREILNQPNTYLFDHSLRVGRLVLESLSKPARHVRKLSIVRLLVKR